ncbi:MAG TPA: hypothetical protein VIF37_20550 [Methylobacter sp.]
MIFDINDQEKLKKYMLEEGISSVDYLIRMNRALLKAVKIIGNPIDDLKESGYLD